MLSREQRREIAGRARTLTERIERPAAGGPAVEDPDEWLSEWADRLDDQSLADRLGSLTRAEARARLATHGYPGPLPAWTERLGALTTYLAETPPSSDPPDEPFAHLLEPIARFGVREMADVPTSAPQPAVETLIETLTGRLSRLYGHVLYVEFEIHRRRRERDGDTADHYETFVATRRASGLTALYERYSLLARITIRLLDGFSGFCERLFTRLERDRPAIERELFDGARLGDLTGLTLRGDPHAGSSQVVICQFDARRVVYKPRSGELAAWVQRVFDLIDSELTTESLLTVERLCMDGYQWVTHVAPAPCETSQDVAQYYRNAGALSCVLYALRFTDGHLQNVLAVGDQPVVLDLETVLQPERGDEWITRSVAATGLLPRHVPSGKLSGGAGFGPNPLRVNDPVKQFRDTNTDEMTLDMLESHAREGQNLPRLNGRSMPPSEYVEQLCTGFERAYRVLLTHVDHLRPLVQQAAGHRGRVLLRPTHRYETVRKLLTEPSYLKTGLKFGCKLEALRAGLDTTPTAADRIQRVERRALLRFDVPRFTHRPDRRALSCAGETIPAVAESPGIGAAFRQLAELSPRDLRDQRRLVRLAYGDTANSDRLADREPLATPPPTVDETARRRHNRHLLARILRQASTQGTTPSWERLRYEPSVGVRSESIGFDLYDGRLGIAVYLAAAGEAFDCTGPTRVIEEIARAVPTEGAAGGLGHGVTSWMYGLVTLARITGTDRYATKARSLLDTLSAEAVTAGETHGVLNGTAGRLLALLAVADETGAPAARRLARRAGDRLLASVESEADLRGWRHPATDTVLTGFAHGTTGIATALCRLTDATGDGRYAETAATCLRSTDAVRHDACHTWADTRPGTYATYRDAWCYGRSGIGLGRLAASAAADVPPPDLSGLVTRLRELFPSDHLCCGNAGRAWFALAAGEQTGIDRYRTVGTQILDQMVRRTAPTEPFRTTWGMGHRSDPTLFHGEAGIGYTLLRATDPTLPAILVGE